MSTPHARPWLEASGLIKHYGGVTALAGVDLAIRPGEIRGLIGMNGAGKSTLVRLLSGEEVADGGEITIEGIALDLRRPSDARAAGIAMMPQELTVAPHLSVADNIVLGQERSKAGFTSLRDLRVKAAAALEQLGVSLPLGAPVASLPLVDQRLVMAARALAADARMIILDEPTAAMAPAEVHLVLKVVGRLSDHGVACIYVSHRLDEIIELSHRVTAMRDGRVIAHVEHRDLDHAALVHFISPEHSQAVIAASVGPNADAPVVGTCTGLVGSRLRGIDLSVRAGEILGIAGLVGSGVDEVMRALAGIQAPRSGVVEVNGTRIGGDRLKAVRAGVGYLPGDRSLALLPNHRVRENVTIASLGRHARLGFASIRREANASVPLLDRVRFSRSHHVIILSLSGGNQQKALFARWLARDLQLLLLDDPTAGVDVGARHDIHEEVRRLAREGLAVVLLSTDLDELVALSHRVLVLNRGDIDEELAGDRVTEVEVLGAMTGTASVSIAV